MVIIIVNLKWGEINKNIVIRKLSSIVCSAPYVF